MKWFEYVIECEIQMLTMWISENDKEHIIKLVLRYDTNMYIIMRITKFNSYKYMLLLGMVINTTPSVTLHKRVMEWDEKTWLMGMLYFPVLV